MTVLGVGVFSSKRSTPLDTPGGEICILTRIPSTTPTSTVSIAASRAVSHTQPLLRKFGPLYQLGSGRQVGKQEVPRGRAARIPFNAANMTQFQTVTDSEFFLTRLQGYGYNGCSGVTDSLRCGECTRPVSRTRSEYS
jgi:hypothetical protein